MAKDIEKQALEQEVLKLRKQVAENEAQQKKIEVGYSSRLQAELAKIRQSQKNKAPLGTLLVRESADHKNITLWSRDGQPVGPLHPANAERFLLDMAAAGVVYTFDKPTPEQVEAYKQTDEYKAYMEWEKTRRARKNKSRKAGQMEKLVEKIAAMSGQKIDEIHKILKASEVKPLSEVRG